MDIIKHYDMLIEEDNDPFRDPPELKAYMERWDGAMFIEAMQLHETKKVLELGVGTGRVAAKVAPCCRYFTGIDISPKTVKRAKENLAEYKNISLICADFCEYAFCETFDVIYATLTMMHFSQKEQVISKVETLLNHDGIFCLSIDKNQEKWIDMGNRKIEIYPDTVEHMLSVVCATSLQVTDVLETDFAHIVVCVKP